MAMTWKQMTAIEPRLLALYRAARAERDTGGAYYCANHVWYTRYKPILLNLVGWYAWRPELRSSECYDLAYDKIYQALPDCRGCTCWPLPGLG